MVRDAFQLLNHIFMFVGIYNISLTKNEHSAVRNEGSKTGGFIKKECDTLQFPITKHNGVLEVKCNFSLRCCSVDIHKSEHGIDRA